MKKSTLKFMLMLIVILAIQAIVKSSWAQAPQKMSYQAVIRNSSNQLVTNHQVGMRISILKGSGTGTAVYTETQNPNTNANGLVNLEIGAGTTSDNFSAIDWANGKYFIKTETDPSGGTNYTIPGISQLLSVPYAFYAQTSGTGTDADTDPTNEIQTISKTGNTVTLSKSGGSVSVDDADADPANEIQTLSISGSNLSLSKGGGTVPLPSSTGGGDNWGIQTVAVDATLSGNGTTATPLKIAQQSATTGQALKWNGTTWKPGKVDADSTNELQELSLIGSNLSLSKGGGTVTLPSSGAGLTLPFAASASYSTTPFSVENKGTAWYSIAGYSDNGHGIFGKTKANNGSGVFGIGTGADISIGVLGQAGDYPTPLLFGNVGVLGQSNANYAVAGNTFSGIGGYFTSESGLALKTTGKLQLTGIGEAAGRVLTCDASGNATWQNATDGGGGLTLPFSQTIANGDYAFSITNSTGPTIKGESNSTSGYGVYGKSPNHGVKGVTTATTGWAYGLFGESKSTDHGYGVFGTSPYIGVGGFGEVFSGESYGVVGETMSTSGYGVRGGSFASTGTTYGVYGISTSPRGYGVYGTSPHVGVHGIGSGSSENSYGVSGETSSTSGFGVYGESYAETGTTYGVFGSSYSSAGTGVKGQASALSGATYGVQGVSSSNAGTGVFGEAGPFGVKGNATYGDGIGVQGTGGEFGVTGISTSSTGIYGSGVFGQAPIVGVRGLASSTDGENYGIYGLSNSSSGIGVYGEAPYAGVKGVSNYTGLWGIGNGYGVVGYSPYMGIYGYSLEGWAGYFEGKLVATGNIGIGVSNPIYHLEVAGAVNISSGITEGAGLRCNGTEALWYDGNYFSWGFGANYNLFWRPISIGRFPIEGYDLTLNGNAIKSGSPDWATWSDIRLKDIHGNYEKGLKEIIALQPVRFSYKKDNNCKLPSDQNYVGFIAQDVQKVFPEAVKEGKDGYLTLDVNDINIALVNAVKELKVENEKLKAESDKLKAENQLLKSKDEQISARITIIEKMIGVSVMK